VIELTVESVHGISDYPKRGYNFFELEENPMAEVRFNVPGRVALVTGGGSGIGRAIALGLAGIGIHVGVGDIDPDRVANATAAIETCGVRSYGLAVDVGQHDDVQRLVAGVSERLGPIDILVNCAGIYPRKYVVETSEAEWDRVLTTNLKGVFLTSQAVLPAMIARKQGRIISITSGIGTTGSPRGAHYAASKGGINAFTRSLAKEVIESGINVNAIAPGSTDTPMMRGGYTPEQLTARAKTMPGGKLGQPEDVVGIVLFMLSDGAKDITGQVITFRERP
jgi:NAD(P)-dependent dehydrogenase (short-subunit alcohol dehydrogenase family)